MLIELVNHFRILLLFGEYFLRLLLNVSLIDVHQALDFVSVILSLHGVLDVLDKVLDLVLLPLSDDLGTLSLGLELVAIVFLLFDILLHL